MAGLRNGHGILHHECMPFLMNLFKYNDNSKNRYSDNYYRASLIEALGATVTTSIIPQQGYVFFCVVRNRRRLIDLFRSSRTAAITAESLHGDTKAILEEVTRNLNLEKLLPCYKMTVTVACLKVIRILQKNGHLPSNPMLFRAYSAYGQFVGEYSMSCFLM